MKISLTAVTVAVLATALAQEADFRVVVDQTVVYVSVLSSSGKPVRGLKVEEFELIEDGTPQTIDFFQEIDWNARSLDSAASSSGEAPEPPDKIPGRAWRKYVDDRYIVLRFDPLLGPRELKRGQKTARRLIEKLDLEHDRVAVSWRNLLSEFTQARQRLFQLVDDLKPTLQGLARLLDDVPAPADGNEDPQNNEEGASLRGTAYTEDIGTLFGPSVDLELFAERVTSEIGRGNFFDGSDLISRLKPLKGRKIVFYIGSGVPALDPSNRDVFDVSRLCVFDPVCAAKVFNDAGFTVYAISPRGLRADDVTAAWGNQFRDPRFGGVSMVRNTRSIGLENIFLRKWTAITGGSAVYGTNSIGRGVDKVLRQSSHSYLIAYRTTKPHTDNRFRKIEVKARGKTRGVRHRGGYFATVPGPVELYRRTILTAMLSPEQHHDFVLDVSADFVPEKPTTIDVAISFPFDTIVMSERQVPANKGRLVKRHLQKISVFVGAFSESGEYLGSVERDFFLSFSDDELKNFRSGNATFGRRIKSKSGKKPAVVKTVVIVGQNEQMSVKITDLRY